jgi:hypothetical protein
LTKNAFFCHFLNIKNREKKKFSHFLKPL